MRSGAASSSASSSTPSAKLTSGTLPGKRPQKLCVREDIGDCPDIDRTPDGKKLCKALAEETGGLFEDITSEPKKDKKKSSKGK